ncbi:MAG: 50S ribosomal protein L33 [Clostridia bacterium]|nr:50S ribosomal protein L33 [Clostridia bacterium]
MAQKGARVKVVFACTECKQRNYNLTKNKQKHPDRMAVSYTNLRAH